MGNPLVTIIICTRNRGARLQATLDALSRIESDHEWDVLMVDNASTDNTAAVITAYTGLGERLHYTKAERIGVGAARDHGWRLASGQLLAFTDDDCYPAPDFVDAIAAAFAKHPDVGLIGGRILLYDPEDLPVTIDTREIAEELDAHSFVAAGSYHCANMAVRRSAVEQVGGFDCGLGTGTKFQSGEDTDVAAAISWAGFKTRYDPSPLVYHHHRRRAADMAALVKGYAVGRGAYYAKYLLRKDSRKAYLKGWTKLLLKARHRSGLIEFARELRSAMAFAVSVGRGDFVLLSAPVALSALMALPFIIAVNRSAHEVLKMTSQR